MSTSCSAAFYAMFFLFFVLRIFFHNKLGSEDEIKIKKKFIQTIFQLNYTKFVFPSILIQLVFPSILIQLENGPNEFYFLFNQPGYSRKDKTKKHN